MQVTCDGARSGPDYAADDLIRSTSLPDMDMGQKLSAGTHLAGINIYQILWLGHQPLLLIICCCPVCCITCCPLVYHVILGSIKQKTILISVITMHVCCTDIIHSFQMVAEFHHEAVLARHLHHSQ